MTSIISGLHHRDTYETYMTFFMNTTNLPILRLSQRGAALSYTRHVR